MRHAASIAALVTVFALTGCASKRLTAELAASTDVAEACLDDLRAAQADVEVTNVVARWAEDRLSAYNALSDSLRAALSAQGEILVSVRAGRLVVRLPTAVYFESGKAELQPEGKAVLDAIAPLLAGTKDRRFLVAGHTDSQPISSKSKTYRSNLELSSMRAVTAFEYLATKGVDPTMMAAAGYGEYLPIADNGTDEGRTLNRRLEIIVLPAPSELPKLPAKL